MTFTAQSTMAAMQTAAACKTRRSWQLRPRLAVVAALATALALAGCGGGGDAGSAAAVIGIDVSVAGSNYAHASEGQVIDVSAAVGQAIEFDANEPVTWSFSVNGSPLFLNGTTVDVGGVTISQEQFDPSRVVLQSTFYGPALLPIDVVLVATSSIDAAQVSTIHLRLD